MPARLEDRELPQNGFPVFRGGAPEFAGELPGAVNDPTESVRHRQQQTADTRDQDNGPDGELDGGDDVLEEHGFIPGFRRILCTYVGWREAGTRRLSMDKLLGRLCFYLVP